MVTKDMFWAKNLLTSVFTFHSVFPTSNIAHLQTFTKCVQNISDHLMKISGATRVQSISSENQLVAKISQIKSKGTFTFTGYSEEPWRAITAVTSNKIHTRGSVLTRSRGALIYI